MTAAVDARTGGGYVLGPSWGAVAQLGERLNGIQEVRGSIPLSSTRYIRQPAEFIALKQIV